MFKFAEMFKDALQMKNRVNKIQKGLKKLRVDAEVAGGMVKVTADGQQNILKLEISSELIEKNDRRLLEDLVRSAVNEALNKSRAKAQEEMQKAFKDLPISPEQLGLT